MLHYPKILLAAEGSKTTLQVIVHGLPDFVRRYSRYTTLIIYQTYADLRAESQRTYIGYLWWIADPVASMFVYYLVFEVVFDRGIENFSVFLFVGLIPWRWFQTSLMSGANSILHSRGVMLQVYLPKSVFPIVSFLTNTVKFLAVFLLLVALLPLFGFPIGLSHLTLPLVLAVQAMFITGCSLIVAGFTPFFPDLRMVLENVVRLWFFMSGIFYSIADLSPQLRTLFRINPMATMIESYRNIIMFGEWPNLFALSGVAVFALILNFIGFKVIDRYDYVYPRLSP